MLEEVEALKGAYHATPTESFTANSSGTNGQSIMRKIWKSYKRGFEKGKSVKITVAKNLLTQVSNYCHFNIDKWVLKGYTTTIKQTNVKK